MAYLRGVASVALLFLVVSCSGSSPKGGAGTGGARTGGSGGASAGSGGASAGSGGAGTGTGGTGAGTGGSGAGGSSDGGVDLPIDTASPDSAGAEVGPGCAFGRTLCGGECVDITSDPRHCNGCGNACGANQVCASSACMTPSDCRQTPCVGLTYCDLATGQCKTGCVLDAQCTTNETCDIASHACVCKPAFHRCAGACASNMAPATCGASCSPCPGDANGTATCNGTSCGLSCNASYALCGGTCAACPTSGATTFTCSGPRCVAMTCATGNHLCGDQCSSNDNTSSCGATSCTACPTSPNGTATCDGTSCGLSCNSGYRACGGACAACPAASATAFGCSGSACVATACASGSRVCGGACSAPTSVNACGASCAVCPTVANGAPTCDGTSCGISCTTGYLACGGLCAPCPSALTFTCAGTQCQAAACASGSHVCSGACASNQSVSSCGSSCTPCPPPPANAAATCDGTSCGFACNSGYVRCGAGCCLDCRIPPAACTSPTWCLASGICSPAQKLPPPLGVAGLFGYAVAVAADLAAVGSPYNNANVGSVTTYQRQSDGNWTAGTTLSPSLAAGSYFGSAVALSGQRMAVGTTGDGNGLGAVYIYDRSNGVWPSAATAKRNGEASGTAYGGAVSLDGDRLLVGAATVQNAGGALIGAAYVYERQSDGSWPTAGTKLVAADAPSDPRFGSSVSISGDRALVGAPFDGSLNFNAGSAYVFVRQTDGSWTQEQKLTAMDAALKATFGLSVSLLGDRALIGAPGDAQLGSDAGAAYVFERQAGGTWVQVAKLLGAAANAGPGDGVGQSVSLSSSAAGDLALVGAPRENRAVASSGGLISAGAAYVYKRQAAGTWSAGVEVNSDPGDVVGSRLFGGAVSLSGTYALIGASNDVSPPSTARTGTAYVVDVRSVLP